MISLHNGFPVSNRLSTAKRQLNALIQQAAARDEVIWISLPRVGAEYAYVGNRLVVDGQPQPVRAS